MTQRFDRATIDHVATLASLSLTDAEAEKLAREIDSILRYVDDLVAIDTSDVPPTSCVQLERTAWRADETKPGVAHDVALAQAPRSSQGGFAVPAFVESEG